LDVRVQLTGRWELWQDVALRAAGFPAHRVEVLCDEDLATAADAAADGTPASRRRYEAAFDRAVPRLREAIVALAHDPLFREAVTWQNGDLVATCLDPAAAGERRNSRGRQHETTIANYLQRYCLKNDTIGFFGPIGWARLDAEQGGAHVVPGSSLLARRTTYFEYWAMDALARALAAPPSVLQWLAPRIPPSCVVSGRTARTPDVTVELSDQQLALLQRCDGRRTVRELVGHPPDAAVAGLLLRLRGLGVLRIALDYDVTRWPERGLLTSISRIADPQLRGRLAAPVHELVAARDEVAAAAGNPVQLSAALRALGDTFRRHTGTAPTRRPGAAYVGRTLVYEDAVRDVDVTLGRPVTDALATALPPLLDAATWLANEIASRYQDACLAVVDAEAARTGRDGVPLVELLAIVMPELTTSTGQIRSLTVDAVVREFQTRWERILGPPDGDRPRALPAELVAAGVAREFGAPMPLWSGARRHSPDVMIAASGAQALAQGDFSLVLGELHVAACTLENRIWAAQHPDTRRLRRACAQDGLEERVIVIPSRAWESSTTRTLRPAAVLLPQYTYVTMGEEAHPVPDGAEVFSAADLVGLRRGDGLVVRSGRDGSERRFLEVVADPLQLFTANAFRPFRAAPHRPRTTVGRMVVGRETWTFDARDLHWPSVRNEADRFAAARHWARAHGMPARVFVVVPQERKPFAVDLRSLPLVAMLAKALRNAATTESPRVSVSEALPDVDALWLTDGAANRYTAELRLTAVWR
jgi:hypothetical protein